MNIVERMVLKRIMIAKIKAFVAKYPAEAHALAIIVGLLITAYGHNPAFHELVLRWFAHVPKDAQTIITVGVTSYLTYSNTKD